MYINVIVVEKNKKAYLKKVPQSTDALRKEMGSGIEFVKLSTDNRVVLVVTSNNTDLGDMNRALYHPGSKKVAEVICGKFLVVAIDDKDNITNLTNKQVVRYMARFGEPELFRIKKDGEITAVKLSNVEQRKKKNKVKNSDKHYAHSLDSIRKSHEYRKRVNSVGKLLDELTDSIPAELLDLLAKYVEEELAFQKFLERECFKAGVEFAGLEKR